MKNALKIIAVLLAASGSLYLAMFRHGAKNYVYGKNDSAWDIYHRFNSDAMNFKDYIQNNNFPELSEITITGYFTKHGDYYVDANEYCPEEFCLTPYQHEGKTVSIYWAIKLTGTEINEVWVYKLPLTQEQLRPYTFEEQVKMVPLFKDDKFEYKSEYVIGYYKADNS